MYGALGSLLLKAAPHVALYSGIGAAGLGVTNAIDENILKDVYRETLEKDGGVFKPKGFTSLILKPFVNEQEVIDSRQTQALNELIVANNENPDDYKHFTPQTSLTVAQGNILGNQRKREKAEEAAKLEKAMEIPRRQMTLAESNQAAANLLAQQQLGLAQQTRADQMRMRADDLKLERERLAREDQRYNDRLERDERRDREKAFIALMGGGLDALGAAFA